MRRARSVPRRPAGYLLRHLPIRTLPAGLAFALPAIPGRAPVPVTAFVDVTVIPMDRDHVLDDRGMVSIGKRADLALLSANPLLDIRRTSEPAGVMVGGRWLSSDALERNLEGYADGH